MSVYEHLQLYLRLGLTPVPLKERSKEPLVKWRNGWNPTPEELEAWASKPNINWAVRCGDNLAGIDCDSEESFRNFTASHRLPPGCPIVKTSRGHHIWVELTGDSYQDWYVNNRILDLETKIADLKRWLAEAMEKRDDQ